MSPKNSPVTGFSDLSLSRPVMLALDSVGYETPSPIQAETIPHILAGRDLLGQAQTGTGKTAAFALPLLSQIDTTRTDPQVLVLAPTRELAIQVAEAFQRYAAHIEGFHVLPIYGGQDYRTQLRQLKRGVQVVVGTPGRVMDHMRRGTLDLSALSAVVLDEADEMLRMGFIDDVEWILEQTPAQRQIVLFSATMPKEIKRIADKHLREPVEVRIKTRTTTAESIRQRYWLVSGLHKLDALTRILEVEPFEGMIIFVRTKLATQELAEKLEARGYASAALNGDIAQKERERVVEKLKQGSLDILIATDVAARGLDVERISHVINYDIPYDTEAYVHRIGRTGRAGRKGEAILFVAPRERRLLHAIEKATRQSIEAMDLPATEQINQQRIERFMQRISDTLASEDLSLFQQLVERYQQENDRAPLEIAAALARMLQGDTPMLLDQDKEERRRSKRDAREQPSDKRPAVRPERPQTDTPEQGMERYRLEVGAVHGVKPANIVGAIANEAGLESQYIDNVTILPEYTTVDLPEGMPNDIFADLKKVRICGQKLNISRMKGDQPLKPKQRKSTKPRGKNSKKERTSGGKQREKTS